VHRGVAGTAKPERLTIEKDVPGVVRHPAERLSTTVSEPALLLLLAGFGVLLANPLRRMSVQIQLFACTRSEAHHSRRRQPLISPRPLRLEGMFLRVVAVVPNEIDRPRLPVEFGSMLISKAEFDSELRGHFSVKRWATFNKEGSLTPP
jgi:hypothetical protein